MQVGLRMIYKIIELLGWLIGFTVFNITSAVSLFVLFCVLRNHFECLAMKKLTNAIDSL